MDIGEPTNVPEAGNAPGRLQQARIRGGLIRGAPLGGQVAVVLVALAWIVVLAIYLAKRIVLSPDSMNNYAHVWWIAGGIWHRSTLPWSMPVIGHGQALTYPYGIVNWTTAALVWPILGDWAITLWTALGAVGCIFATFAAFPELRRGWWAAGVLANPAIILALLFGQQSFAWAAMLLLLGVACWRRERPLAAAILVGLGQANHPAVVLPIGLIMVAVWLRFEPNRQRLLRWYALSTLISLPAAILVFASPAYEDTTMRDRIVNFFSTLGPRILIIAIPVGFLLMLRSRWRVLAPLALAVSLFANLALQEPVRANLAWRSLRRKPDLASIQEFTRSPQFHRGDVYRILRGSDSKLGLYSVLKAGGRLDSEFFPESAALTSFPSSLRYTQMLCKRGVDAVVDFKTYDDTRHTNEHAVLRQLARDDTTMVGIRSVASTSAYEVFAVDRTRCRPS